MAASTRGGGWRASIPAATIAENLPIDRVLGCVVYPAAEIAAPGVIRHIEGNRFSLGEIDNSSHFRASRRSRQLLPRAGFKAPVVSDLRVEIWMKLWGNASFNPVSALTHATLEDICRYPPSRALVYAHDGGDAGDRRGARRALSAHDRQAHRRGRGDRQAQDSMLQDVEAGRAIEADALIGAVIEMGRIVGVNAPRLEAVYALVKLTAKTLQDERGRLEIEPLAAIV